MALLVILSRTSAHLFWVASWIYYFIMYFFNRFFPFSTYQFFYFDFNFLLVDRKQMTSFLKKRKHTYNLVFISRWLEPENVYNSNTIFFSYMSHSKIYSFVPLKFIILKLRLSRNCNTSNIHLYQFEIYLDIFFLFSLK